MTTFLTPEEKKTIVEQHMKTIAFSEYNLSLSLIEANAMTDKNQTNIDSLNAQMQDVIAQKSVLQSELDVINAEINSAV
jgi:uncharacterized coiled-coil DUF342 family protein